MAEEINVVPAGKESTFELLTWLARYYQELSRYTPWLYDEAMPFSYPGLDSYWDNPLHHPFLLQYRGEPAGFAFVHNYSHISGSTEVNDIEEFSIFPECRRTGVGRACAHRLFRLFPGSWVVRVRESNGPGMSFWQPVIAEFAAGDYRQVPRVEDGSVWYVYEFASPPQHGKR
jgi:predicted acetyltransferase